MRAFLAASLALVTLAQAARAHAAGPSVTQCLEATETSSKLRSENRIRAALPALLVCASPSCPSEVRVECIHRQDEFNAAMPTVVFTVKTGSGEELTAVRVTMDGDLVADHLDGTAIKLDPGQHRLTFEPVGQPATTQTFILHEGEKDRRESIVVGPAVAAPTAAAEAPSREARQSWRVAGYVVGATGVVGLGVGALFGGLAASSWSTAQKECPSHTGCSAEALHDHTTATTFAGVSTAGFIAGGVLVAGGLTLVLAAPRDARPVASLALRPGAVLAEAVF